MIAKITTGDNFSGIFEYVLKEEKRPIILLHAQQSLGRNAQELTREFEKVANLRPSTKKPVIHYSIAFAPEDGDVSLVTQGNIANEIVEKMGYTDCQYVTVAHHRDDPGHSHAHNHSHMHILINAITFGGDRISDHQSFRRMENILRDIERDYNLRQVPSSWEVKKQWNQLDPNLEELRSRIVETLTDRPDLETWLARLASQKITPRFKLTNKDKLVGVQFIDLDKGEATAHNGVTMRLGWHTISQQLTDGANPDIAIIKNANNQANETKVKLSGDEKYRFDLGISLALKKLNDLGTDNFRNSRIEIELSNEILTLRRNRPRKVCFKAMKNGEKWEAVGLPNLDKIDIQNLQRAALGKTEEIVYPQIENESVKQIIQNHQGR